MEPGKKKVKVSYPRTCEKCNHTYTTKQAFSKHLERCDSYCNNTIKVSIYPRVCVECKETFENKVKYHRHLSRCGEPQKKIPPSKCAKCPLIFSRRSEMIAHVVKDHIQGSKLKEHLKKEQNEVKVEKPQSKIQCTKCSLMFSQRCEMFAHVVKDHIQGGQVGDNLKEGQAEVGIITRKKTLSKTKCTKCSLIFSNRSDMIEHFVKDHIEGVKMRENSTDDHTADGSITNHLEEDYMQNVDKTDHLVKDHTNHLVKDHMEDVNMTDHMEEDHMESAYMSDHLEEDNVDCANMTDTVEKNNVVCVNVTDHLQKNQMVDFIMIETLEKDHINDLGSTQYPAAERDSNPDDSEMELEQGQTSQITLKQKHLEGVGIADTDVFLAENLENVWVVASGKGVLHFITLHADMCGIDHCYERCLEDACSNLCSHLYSCTCPDKTTSMCKHIHKVHSLRVRLTESPSNISTEKGSHDVQTPSPEIEITETVEESCTSIFKEKVCREMCLHLCKEIQNKISSCSSLEMLEYCESNLQQILDHCNA